MYHKLHSFFLQATMLRVLPLVLKTLALFVFFVLVSTSLNAADNNTKNTLTSRIFNLKTSARFDLWGTEHKGHMQVEGDRVHIPREANFNHGDDSPSFEIEIKNITRFAPSLRVHYLRFNREATVNRNTQTTFGNIVFSDSKKQNVSLNVFNLGILSYFSREIYPKVRVSYGAELRRFSGEIRYSGEDANTRSPSEVVYDITGNIISYLPLAYGAVTYTFTDVPLKAHIEGTGMLLSEYSLHDVRFIVTYAFDKIVIGAGSRELRFAGKDEIEYSDIAITNAGTFVRVGVDF